MRLRAAGFEARDAIRLDIDRDHGFAIGQQFRKIADAAADFEHAPPQLRKNQAGLPCEIIPGARHALLVGDRVV